MKVQGLVMIIKTGEFVEVLLDVQLSALEAKELKLDKIATLNLIYDLNGECIISGLLDANDIIEISLTDAEVEHVNQYLYDNSIYAEVLGILQVIESAV